MRIALLAWESLHSISVGGVAPHVSELAAGLERRGHEVHVFVRLGEHQCTYEVIDGVHYHRCPIELNDDFVTEMNNMGNAFVYFLAEDRGLPGCSVRYCPRTRLAVREGNRASQERSQQPDRLYDSFD